MILSHIVDHVVQIQGRYFVDKHSDYNEAFVGYLVILGGEAESHSLRN